MKDQRSKVGTEVTRLAAVIATALLIPQVAPAAPPAGDAIERALEDQLLRSRGVDADDVEVVVADGVVSLTGQVDTLLARRRAVALAGTIRGVRAVIDQLSVRDSLLTDEMIRQNVYTALIFDPATDGFEVKISVDAGQVTMDGRVDSWQEKQLCEAVVSGVRGVREIANHLLVVPAAERPDTEIEDEVERRLYFDVWVEASKIDVEVTDGLVNLSGSVASPAAKQRAIRNAWVDGTRSVESGDLEVNPHLLAEMEIVRRPVSLEDAEIASAVQAALLYDPRLLGFRIRAAVDDGVVTLIGEVDNHRARLAAGRDAVNTRGVARVDNRLEVVTPVDKLDNILRQRILAAFERDALLAPDEVQVTVVDGRADLSGIVHTPAERQRAVEVAASNVGIKAVEDHLEFSRDLQPALSDQAIGKRIEVELHMAPHLKADALEIEVDDGVATLSGVVDFLANRVAAERAAFEAGATGVRNRIRVRTAPAPAAGRPVLAPRPRR